ncbi:hypothetical protein G647_02268 [Cladophialophora carrionii CBS 160.54]|uniref:Uncharacterized protein n=1 Tax=Cladophialophora carrionii CBS 160.54 TaxID=1279043 RepID=V9DF66_9EURO|nr:uncharacterized protein G647_02268 [Cladophialophora carrionii CBS 160.54]ETI25495.1 hypothetical protein G647_02268 [Cladophialophora carrionii CBS 160.54]
MFDGATTKTAIVHRDEHGSAYAELAEDSDDVHVQANELLGQQEPQLLISVSPSFGGALDELRSLDYWLDQTGPTLANYGPNFGFWCSLIPMWAWRSDIIRNLLAATTLIDEQLGLYRTATSSDLSPTAIWHYHAAIQGMAMAKQPDKLCLTLASMLAWVFETLQKNYSAAKIHVRAASRLLSELEAPSDKMDKSTLDLITQLNSVLQLSASYTKAICEDNVDLLRTLTKGPIVARAEDLTIPPVESLIHARDLLLDSISRYIASDKTEHSARLQRLYIKSWHKAMRRYCSCSTRESHVYKKSVQLCFNLGMAFLPESEAGTFSYQATPNAVRHLLEAYERLVVEKQTRGSGPENDSIDKTIVMALELILDQVHHVHLRARAALLLQKLTAHHEKVGIQQGRLESKFD